MTIRPWRELFEEDQDSNEDGLSSFSPDSYMQDEIDELRAALAKMSADFEATVEHMNDGCICGRAPAPKHPVDLRLLKP